MTPTTSAATAPPSTSTTDAPAASAELTHRPGRWIDNWIDRKSVV